MRLRVIVLAAIATAFVAVLAWGAENYNTSGRWVKEGAATIPDGGNSSRTTSLALGHSSLTGITAVTDGGTVTIDGTVQADVGPIVSLASGALTANTINVATAAADYVMPACETANIGEWVTVVVRDVSEVVVLQPARGDTLSPAGAIISADHEMDSAGAATSDGDHVTFACLVADIWHSLSIGGAWVDGGAS